MINLIEPFTGRVLYRRCRECEMEYEDCVCCNDCNSHPCECVCLKCGERLDGDEYMDACECVE